MNPTWESRSGILAIAGCDKSPQGAAGGMSICKVHKIFWLLLVFACLPTSTLWALPNLTPYQPSGWSDKIVVARTASSTTDSTSLTTADTLYVNAAVINNGTTATTANFNNEIFVDGVGKTFWVTAAPFNVNSYSYLTTGYSIGQLSAGTHTITVTADYGGVIAESNEGDNSYTKTITVGSPAQPNLTPYQPPGWSDKIVVSTTAGSETDSTSLTTADTLYVGAAVINDGAAPTVNNFENSLFVDGVGVAYWTTPAPLGVGAYSSSTGYSIGRLSAGTHTITLTADYAGTVAESNEGDNSYTKTISVATVNVPTVQTLPATSIGTSTATLNAQITSTGGSPILEQRFSWGSTPACSDGYTSAVTVNGNNFSYNLAEIPPGTYYFEAWAENSAGWGNSAAASFNTASAPAPTISSVSPSNPTGSSTSQPFYINGANFVSGCNVILRDITANQTFANRAITTFSSTQIRIDPIFTTEVHSWSVEIQNPDSQSSGQFPFNVVAPGAPTLTVTSPNGGENWMAGTARAVTWTVSDPLSQINYYLIDYSLDGGVTWVFNAASAYPPSTSATWSILSNIASTQVLVRVKAFNSKAVQLAASVSANDFTISPTTGIPTAWPTCNNRAPSPASTVIVNFNGSASTGSSSSCGIASYLWTFDDGTSSSSENPSHAFYPAIGTTTTYNVNLTVTDCGGKQASANLTVYITGQALGNNPTQPKSPDPVNLATGNYTYNHLDLQIPGRGLPFEFQRYYNSKATTSTGLPLGFGWTDSYNIGLSVSPSNNAVVIVFGDGHEEMYATNGAGEYIAEPGVFNVLTASGGSYTLETKAQQKYNFNSSGQLTSIADKNRNTVSMVYTGSNLTTITDTVGRLVSFAYNANNCLTNITDPLGRTIIFAYDANTNLVNVTDTRGDLTQFGYDQYHQLTNAIDPRGNTFVSMVYDDEQRVVSSQKDALQGATTFSYDFVNNVTTVTDAMNNVSYDYFDPQLRVKKTVDNLGNSQFFQYDTNNNRTMVIDRNGAVTAYTYDGNGNVISKTDPFQNTTTISYDSENNPTNRSDALGGLTLFSYDENGNLTNTLNSLSKTNAYQYDGFGEPVVVTDANGNSSTNVYDAYGNLVETLDSLGDTNAFVYDIVSRKIGQTDALGRTNMFIYDNANNLTASVNALGKTNYFSYDGNNNRVTTTDFLGNTTTNIYDQKDRLIIITDPLGDSVTNTYDALDRKVLISDAMGGGTQYAYDAVGNLLAITNAVGAVTRYAYDPNGNRTNIVDALGNSTKNTFDSLSRLVSTTDALGLTTTSVYDALGRRVQGIDALNRTSFFAYDSMGRLTNFTDTAGGTIVNAYDNVGNRVFSTDPNGHTTTNVFDSLNRLVQTADPDGGVAQLGYDAVGNLISRKDPNGNITIYQYDANNRRTKMIYPIGTPVSFGYDDNGNRTNMTDSLGTTVYLYDSLNRITSITDCYGKTVSYGYDKNGNRTSVNYPGNKALSYFYDAANRLKSVTDWLNNVTTYNYDADGNLTNSVNPNGTAAVYQYDAANRLVALTNTANSTAISSYQYSLDAVGNHSRVSQTEPIPTTPVLGQTSYAYDNDNKQIILNGQTQGFDANGNMISLNPTNLLAYDYENRLVQTSFAGTTNTYQYDGAGNRMSAARNGVLTRYVLDRNSPLAQVFAETDSSGNVIYYYIYGLGLVSRIDAGGNVQYYHYDSRGSTIATTSASGQIVESYAYDPFGQPMNALASDNHFRYLGRHGVFDEENGLAYIRARYYSSARGRFITRDPTSGKDGDSQSMNRYIYALNNPIRLIDISGLSAQESSDPVFQFVTSDSIFSHNWLISPPNAYLATSTAQSTPPFETISNGRPLNPANTSYTMPGDGTFIQPATPQTLVFQKELELMDIAPSSSDYGDFLNFIFDNPGTSLLILKQAQSEVFGSDYKGWSGSDYLEAAIFGFSAATELVPDKTEQPAPEIIP